MKLTGQEAEQVVYGDHDDWEEVQGTVCDVGHSRWSIQREGVFKHIPSGKHYEFYWQIGATEQQDESPFEYEEEVEPVEVESKLVTLEQWVAVEK